jgi:hypothetical protein
MNDELDRNYRRWQRAEENGQDDDAESAFREVYSASMSDPGVSPTFTASTMAAVASRAARDARRAARMRAAALIVGIGGGALITYFSAGFVVSLLSAAFARGLDALVGLVVSVATSGRDGSGLWTVLTSLGRAAAAFAANPTVTVAIFAMQAVAIGALVALQRLLGSDGESFK